MAPPTGTVTFLFTDIQGSTGLLQARGDAYRDAKNQHDEVIRTAAAAEDGWVVSTAGDSFFVAFASAVAAVRAAVAVQQQLAGNDWSGGVRLAVRMGLHTGQGTLDGADYVGIDVHRAARIAAAAHGGQILLSAATRALVEQDLPDGISLRDLGAHRLRDIAHPQRLSDLIVAGLPSDFPPIRSLAARRGLPVPLTSFVGRADEMASTMRLLDDHRLVTLTGPGGSGKTRLALEVAAHRAPSLGDGVFFVDLAPVTDPAQVPATLAHALGVREVPDRELVDVLVDRLAGMQAMVVLDNVEHVLPAAALVDRLLREAPALRILATSRSPLRLYGEQEQPVPPLTLPDAQAIPTPDGLARYGAIMLFVERARAVLPSFALTSHNAHAVVELCTRLDGLPLAIELAASRVKLLPPRAIASRLAGEPDLLSATARNLPARQRSLRAAIGWSAGLLTEPERRLYARLSVFRGGAALDAVEAVGNPDHDLGVDTVAALGSLVDNSLVVCTEPPDGEPRFGMLETIRQHAAELLDSTTDTGPTHRRHAEHYFSLAVAGEPHLVGEDQAEWLHRFEREHDNFQAAFSWAIAAAETARALAAAAALWRFWQQRGYLSVGRTWLERLLARSDVPPTAALGMAHVAVGGLAYWQGDYPAAHRHYQQSMRIAREVGDELGVAEATYNLAFVPEPDSTPPHDVQSGAAEVSLTLLREAMQRFTELGDLAGVAKAKGNMALFLGGKGDLHAAVPLLAEAIDAYRTVGDRFHLADNLMAYGQGMQMLGDQQAARAAFVEALGLVHEADNRAAVALSLECLAAIESSMVRHERAATLTGCAQQARSAVEGTYPLSPTALFGTDAIGDARRALGDEAAERALAHGRSMSQAEAVAYAAEAG
ncbi:MAG: hypothetical protein ICV70_07575 [Jiangellaceae bacterium]|nr:hypothetical protein [Jiangellaceae bacterium]